MIIIKFNRIYLCSFRRIFFVLSRELRDLVGHVCDGNGVVEDLAELVGVGHGLRHAHADSPNLAWRNASFRGYADYMQTDAFAENLEQLIGLAKQGHIALMCAEAVPWRCHRSLIADALTVRGIPVEDIMSPTLRQPHTLTPWARVDGSRITYPAE